MAKHQYKVASQEGADFCSRDYAPVEVGDVVELDLPADQKLALICAGWLEEEKKGGKK